jgi:uridine kinase
MPYSVTPNQLVEEIRGAHASLAASRAFLVGISGIDGSGKGWIARRLARMLEDTGLGVALLGVDLWLNLPPVRFSADRPGKHFYQHALRLEELLARAVLPLREWGRLDLVFDAVEETATAYRPERWSFGEVDVIVLEGIFLFKRGLRAHYDLAVWLDCSFETALERALARGQEGLPPGETVRAYETIYFPAQRVHFEADDPRNGADRVLNNDTPAVRPA